MRNQFDNDPQPDLAEVVDQVTQTIRRNVRRIGPILLGLIILGYVYLGTYTVGPGEQGVVRTFGKESKRTASGLHFRFPLVESVDIVNLEKIWRIEVGVRGEKRVPMEALMLTGDENIVEAQMIVQYRISDPSKYLFEIKDAEETLRFTAEVALRSTVGRTNIDEVITTGREQVQSETQTWLQKLMDEYESGLAVTEVKLQMVDAPDEVKEAFHDVVRAREEKEKLINKARGYQEDLIPRAQGEARKKERGAEAYQEQRVLRAKGDAEKFKLVLAEYEKAERVTRERMYLETLERVLSKIDHKVVVDGEMAKGVLPLLPLQRIVPRAAGKGQ